MQFEVNTYSLLYFVAGIVSIITSYLCWQKRSLNGAKTLAIVFLLLSEWALIGALELMAVDISAKILFSKFAYFGTILVPVVIMIFAFEFSNNQKYLTKRFLILIFIIPVLTILLAFLNEFHYSIWSGFRKTDNNVLIYEHGISFYLFAVAYSYLCVIITTVLLLIAIRKQTFIHKTQVYLLLTSISIVWIGNVIYIFELSPFTGLDTTPISFILSGICLYIALTKFSLLDFVPVARSLLLETIDDYIIAIDLSERILDVNKSMLEFLKLPIKDVVEKNISDIFKNEKEILKIINDNDEGRFEVQSLNTYNYWYEITINKIISKNDIQIGRLIIIRDISDKVESDKFIRLLSTAFEQSPIMAGIIDAEGRLEFINPKFEEITGYSSAEVKDNYINILNPSVNDLESRNRIWNTIRSGKIWSGEYYNTRKNGEPYIETIIISPVRNKYDEITNYIILKEDITERKKIEEELILSKEKAEESNRIKSNFLSNMSHELRTPLFGILGFSDLLSDVNNLESVHEYAKIIHTSAKRLSQTLNLILELSNSETEGIVTQYKLVDIVKVLNDIIKILKPSADEKNLFINTEFERNNINLLLDENLIKSSFTNLVDNAIKYTKSGGITIKVNIKDSEKDKKLIIKISDTGIGIPRDKQDIIFDEFRQVSEGLGRTFEGSGIGLTLTKKFIEKMNGKIYLESEVNKGSTFIVEFNFVDIVK